MIFWSPLDLLVWFPLSVGQFSATHVLWIIPFLAQIMPGNPGESLLDLALVPLRRLPPCISAQRGAADVAVDPCLL